jgi:16S rRNA G1207 methylase RsmC
LRYTAFNNIVVRNEFGVSPVGDDTFLVASVAAQFPAQRILDVGTGTGFTAIYLASLGRSVVGADVDPRAIECARKNASMSGVEVDLVEANLLEGAAGPYDLIIFNPPYGGRGRGLWSRFLRFAKSVLPKGNRVLSYVAYRFVKRGRRLLLKELMKEAPSRLGPEGSLLLLVDLQEVDLLAKTDYEHLACLDRQLLVRAWP